MRSREQRAGDPGALRSAIQRVCRLGLLPMMLACAQSLPIAQATERPGDARNASDLHQRAISVTAVQTDLLTLTEAASGKEQFALYRTYDESMGTWLQVEFLRELLDLSIAATSTPDEQKLRTDLRDQARFAVW